MYVFDRLLQPTYDSYDDIDVSFLSLRVGTKFGIVTHLFRVDSKVDLDHWINSMTQSIRNAVIQTNEVAFRMSYLFIDIVFFLLIRII